MNKCKPWFIHLTILPLNRKLRANPYSKYIRGYRLLWRDESIYPAFGLSLRATGAIGSTLPTDH